MEMLLILVVKRFLFFGVFNVFSFLDKCLNSSEELKLKIGTKGKTLAGNTKKKNGNCKLSSRKYITGHATQ
jgi:hypothetical protein